jgi:hypothetical protein
VSEGFGESLTCKIRVEVGVDGHLVMGGLSEGVERRLAGAGQCASQRAGFVPEDRQGPDILGISGYWRLQVHLTAGPSKERARGGLGDVVEGGLEWRRSLDWRGRHTAVCLIGTSTQEASEGGVRQGLPQVLTGGRVRGKRVFYRSRGASTD